MTTLQVRDIDPRDHEALKATAQARGMSLQVYITEVLHREAVGERNRRLLAEHERRLHEIAGEVEPLTSEEVLAGIHGARRERLAHTTSLVNGAAAS